ncbi:MAG: nucleotidyltransferase domain-containing protein [Bauldia sp.]
MTDTETVLARDITRDQLVAELRALRPAFEGEGVAHMALFGSRARGENRPDSDVDLLVDIVPGRKFSLVEMAGIANTVEDRIGLVGNIFLRRSTRPELLDEARRDGITVF